jgi:hypothetical protein
MVGDNIRHVKKYIINFSSYFDRVEYLIIKKYHRDTKLYKTNDAKKIMI